MSSEVQLNGIHAELSDELGLGGREGHVGFDRVLWTAADHPAAETFPAPVDPAACCFDGEIARRRADVDAKHQRVIGFLDEHEYDAVVLRRADSIAWFTAGGDLGQGLEAESGAVALFVNRTCRAVLADNVQSPRIFEEELAGLGFQLKERPWHHDPLRVVSELTHQKRAASDDHLPGLVHEADRLAALRRPMTALERESIRTLGQALALAVEATCRNIRPEETEAEVAGQLAHRLIRQGIVPVDLRVAGEDRQARYRQPPFKSAAIRGRASIAATGRRNGLCASVHRTVSFGRLDSQFRECHTLAAMVDATSIFFSRPGEPVSEVLRRARRIYEKFGHPHEWTLDYQGCLIGHSPREVLLLPDSTALLESGSALCWSPSVGSARSGDTVAIDDRGFEVVTQAREWPEIEVTVKGHSLPRPGVLVR